ncbi:MAG TPA: (deoxy)nucleoside triphosphate pyrophosphohydrolase [Prolixibacteraceae bacterium]|nr:(deoxy)nucleoside triphosphate pyrophosphohydrolase [Prolixibacteraceae bacterium]
MNRIDVTCAIIIKEGKLLACQRGPRSEHAYEWEFPGGKVEDGESPEACIVREIWEELKVDILVLKQLTPINYDYPRISIRLIPFLCRIDAGNPSPVEHHTIRWQPINRFADLLWSAADKTVFDTNKEALLC